MVNVVYLENMVLEARSLRSLQSIKGFWIPTFSRRLCTCIILQSLIGERTVAFVRSHLNRKHKSFGIFSLAFFWWIFKKFWSQKTSVNLDKKYGRDISRLSWTLKENKAGKVGITQSLNQCNCEDILLSNMTRRIYICIIKRHKSTKNTIQQLDDWVCCLNWVKTLPAGTWQPFFAVSRPWFIASSEICVKEKCPPLPPSATSLCNDIGQVFLD